MSARHHHHHHRRIEFSSARRRTTLLLASTLLSGGAAAQAQTTTWTDGKDSWFAPNWTAGVPTAAVNAQINNGGTALVAADNAQAKSLILGYSPGTSGNLEVYAFLGIPGTLTLSDVFGVFVGLQGSGTMKISGGATISDQTGVIGYDGAPGTVTVAGTGSRWTNTQDLVTVAGSLTVSSGGKVTDKRGLLGGATSATLVSGAGSTWTNTEILDMTNTGGGADAITIADSGLVTVGGQVTIGAADTIHIGAGGVPGTLQAASVANSGTLHFNHSGAATFSVPLLGAGNVLKDGAGTTTLTSAASFVGTFTAQAGRLALQGGVNPASTLIANTGATLRLDGAVVSLGDIVMRANAGGTIEYFNARLNGGFLRGPGTHTLLAGGTTTLSGVTTFNSATILQGGTDTFDNVTNGGKLTNNGTLYYDGGVNASSGVFTVNGALFTQDFSNNGVITVNNGGVLQTDAAGLVSGGGSRTTVNAGGKVFIANGATWELNGALLVNNGSVNGAVHVNYGSLVAGAGTFGPLTIGAGGAYTPGVSLQSSPAPAVGGGGTIAPLDPNQVTATSVVLAVDTLATVAAADGSLTFTSAMTSGTGKKLTKAGGGTLAVAALRGVGLAVQDGTLKILPDGSAAGASSLNTLAIPGSGSKFDLTNNKLIVTSGNVAAIAALIASGRNGGSWNGSGIVTSSASGNFTTFGIATAQQAGRAGGTFGGLPVAAADVLVMYTYGGDANLDGKINVDDYGRIDFNAALGTSGWFNGDFNYDGKINVDDYGIIDFNIGIQGAPFPTGAGVAGAATAVPEPTGGSVLLAGAACVGAGTRAKRRRRPM